MRSEGRPHRLRLQNFERGDNLTPKGERAVRKEREEAQLIGLTRERFGINADRKRNGDERQGGKKTSKRKGEEARKAESKTIEKNTNKKKGGK